MSDSELCKLFVDEVAGQISEATSLVLTGDEQLLMWWIGVQQLTAYDAAIIALRTYRAVQKLSSDE